MIWRIALLQTADDALRYLHEIDALLPDYKTNPATPIALRLTIRNGKRQVMVRADPIPSGNRFDVFLWTEENVVMSSVKPGERIPVSGTYQTSSGNAAEVAGEVRRFLGEPATRSALIEG
jgi:hypothetical protein